MSGGLCQDRSKRVLPDRHRFQAPFAGFFAAALALALSACVSPTGGPAEAPAKPQAAAPPTAIGSGRVKAALILPLSAQGNLGAAGKSLKNAAELAVSEFQGSDVQLIVKDDGGTAEGARLAAEEAIADGVQVIIGPLIAPAVQAVGQIARPAGKPVIAFSTDASVAASGVYLLSFMPESDVDRIVDFAASKGKRSIAALIPETSYGTVVAGAFQEASARRGIRVAALERFKPGDRAAIDAAVKRIAALGPQADALFLPENGEGMALIAPALTSNGIDNQRLQLLGTGVWDDARVLKQPALQGGWFAAPDKSGYTAFAGRYRARYGAEPSRIAPLSYDAVFLVSALVSKYGAAAFSEATLTQSDGIVGTDGLFRFRPDGTSQRGLAVLQVTNGAATTLSPAPRSFGQGGA
jgi:branched-chain amino acid transport system substrate-binding protein